MLEWSISCKCYPAVEAGRKRELRLSTLERLARAYGLEPWQLLAPDLPEGKLAAKRDAAHPRRSHLGLGCAGQAPGPRGREAAQPGRLTGHSPQVTLPLGKRRKRRGRSSRVAARMGGILESWDPSVS